MIKKILMFIIGLIVFYFTGYYLIKVQRPGDFIFYYNVPEFKKEQKELLKKVLPEIFKQLENPERYYVAGVEIGDTSIVSMFDLNYLQSGGNSKGTHIQTTLDGSVRFYIGKNHEIIKIQPDEI